MSTSTAPSSGATTNSSRYRVADHLVDRLAELGVDRMFGVPGDYSLALLDHVTHHPTVRWTGCANELNAGYAADGYGRIRGMAALCTTFGVGELSAINAITGSYGAPALATQALRRPIHHSLGDGEFGHVMAMHTAITCARAALTPGNAVAEIDRVLIEVRNRRLPGYLLVRRRTGPGDPRGPAAAPAHRHHRPGRARHVRRRREAAARPRRVGRGRQRARRAAGAPLRRGPAPVAAAGRGPGAARHDAVGQEPGRRERARLRRDLLGATGSTEQTRRAVEDAAALILAGVPFTDLNSGLSSQRITRARTIELGARSASVGAATFAPLELPTALVALEPLVTGLDRSAPPATTTPRASGGGGGCSPCPTVVRWSAAIRGAGRSTGSNAGLIGVRDGGLCRDPYCDAPIRHVDHIRPHRAGGPTSFANGRGVCARGNYVREMPGWRVDVVDDGLGRHPHTVRTTTPTGHTYTSTAGPAP